MASKNRGGRLNSEEKRIVKGLLAEDMRNQDVQALINMGRADLADGGFRIIDLIELSTTAAAALRRGMARGSGWPLTAF